jgi:hypothetical protein
MMSEVYNRKVGTRDEMVARILHVADSQNKREDQHRRATRKLRTRFAE